MLPTSSRLLGTLAVTAALVFLGVAKVAAESPQEFYKGKTIKFLVGTGAGGGFDAYARMIAPHLEKQTGATVIVQNMPGGGGLVAANHLYAEAKGDPLQMLILNGNNAAMSQLVGDPNVRFDLPKFGLLGIVTTSPWIWIASPKSKMQKLDDFMKPGVKITWSGSGQIGGLSDGAAVTCHALKLDCKIVRGYQGSAQGALALARGETDAMYVSDGSANSYVKAGNAIPVVAVTTERSTYFPKLPTVFEALKLNDEQKWWFEFRSAIDDVQRILAMPPGVPQDKLAFMQTAIRAILTDPAIIAEGKKSQRFISYKDPATVKKMIDTVLVSITPEQRKTAREVVMKE
jgi:tripartite-type tricarboxylate transporter receptor subunit TctC